MRPNIETLDADAILATIVGSCDRLTGQPARRKWIRAILRRVCQGQPWSRGLRASLYLYIVDIMQMEHRHRRLVEAIRHRPAFEPALDVAMALATSSQTVWDALERERPLASVVRCLCAAHFRLGRSPHVLDFLMTAVEALPPPGPTCRQPTRR